MSSSEEEVEFSDKNSDESPLSSSPEYEIEHERDGLWSLIFKKGYYMQWYIFCYGLFPLNFFW